MLCLYLCAAAAILSTASTSVHSLSSNATETVRKLNDRMGCNNSYQLKNFSHTCEIRGNNRTTIATFLTLEGPEDCKNESLRNFLSKKAPSCLPCCPIAKTEKRTLLDCVMIETNFMGRPSTVLGYICDSRRKNQQSTLIQLNRNCSNMTYESSKSIVQINLPKESRLWGEKLPLYVPVQCEWNSSAELFELSSKKNGAEGKGNGTDLWSGPLSAVATLLKPKSSKNPLGRQGIAGPGRFPHLGANKILIPVIVRNGTKDGQLQVVVQEGSEAPFNISLPWVPRPDKRKEEPVGTELTREFSRMWHIKYEERTPFGIKSVIRMYEVLLEETIIYKGPIHDKRNTDDAWLHIRFFEVNDSQYKFMTCFRNDSKFRWKNITDYDLYLIRNYYVDAKRKIFL